MTHTASILRIIEELDGDGPAGWHTTPEIAEAAADYWSRQHLSAVTACAYTRNILGRLLKMGKVEIANAGRGTVSLWRRVV